MKCIAVGCTSGYKSNPEKIHYFRVPKNNDKAKEWQKASRRNDIALNSSHCFCEKHFTENDIVWKKIFRNKDGEIIQEIPLKRPYVKEDGVPSLFPWTEFTDKNYMTDNTENVSLEKINENCMIEDTESVYSEKNNIKEIEGSDILTFNELKCNDKLYVPIGWTRNILSLENSSVIIFCKMMCKTVDKESHLISIKEIWITEDMKMQMKALGKPIQLNIFGINNEVLSSLNVLEDLIKIFETFNICEAYKANYKTEYTSVALNESNNIIRHEKCPIVLKNTTQCNCCKSLRYILDKKRQRLNDKGSQIKRIRADKICPTKKNVIDNIRKQKHTVTQCKNRKICTVQTLREEIEKIQGNINAKSGQMLEDAIAEKNIPIHQQEALREIVSSSSKNNAKGRRYSDKSQTAQMSKGRPKDILRTSQCPKSVPRTSSGRPLEIVCCLGWILLCLLFHMRSPKGYDFILNNKILPLPSPSTIRRYLSCIQSCCGFDSNFFQLFKAKMLQRNENERHGILLIDEMTCKKDI